MQLVRLSKISKALFHVDKVRRQPVPAPGRARLIETRLSIQASQSRNSREIIHLTQFHQPHTFH